MPQHFLARNRVTDPLCALTATSEDAAHPLAYLRDQAPGKPWRSRPGWTFGAFWNDRGRVRRAGVAYTFVIASGHYPTAAAVCLAVISALEAADPTPAWNCTYDPGTYKFSITSDSAFEALCADDEASLLQHPWTDLGFSLSANRSAATTQTADSATYQSRHYIGLTLPAPEAVSGYVLAWEHGAMTGAARLGYTTLPGGGGILHAARIARNNDAMAGDAQFKIRAVNTGPYQHWALVLDNTGNSAGFTELGNWYLGDSDSITYNWTFTGYGVEYQELSGLEMSVSGAHSRSDRGQRRTWAVDWDALSETDMATLRELRALKPRGKNMWVIQDPSDLTVVRYVWMDSLAERLASPTLYNPAATFIEALKG